MLKKLFAAALLAGASVAAQADTGWIVVKGVYDNVLGVDRLDKNLYGKFEGTDVDNDGVIRTDELDYVMFEGGYFGTECSWPWGCSLDFAYTKDTGDLKFDGYLYMGDPEHLHYSRSEVHFGNWYTHIRSSGEWYYKPTSWAWRDYTTVSISAVPEPATYALLAGGLAVLAVARRRAGQKQA